MAEDDDNSQKTEEPTRKRLDEAAERGQVITSRETTSFFILFAFTLIFGGLLPGIMRQVQNMLAPFIQRPESFNTDNQSIGLLVIDLVKRSGTVLIVPFAAIIAAIAFANALQNRFVFSVEPLIPRLDKLSPWKGLKRLFSVRSITEFLKSLVKLVIVASVAWYAIAPYIPHAKQLPDVSIQGTMSYLFASAKRLMIGICIIMFFFAIFDYLYQRFEFMKSLRMSKQEVQDEFKQQEGDPQIKGKLRQIRRDRARKRMIAAVPTADVIVTNPTHYSVALKYDQATMRAPKVVAKGLDNIALRIREVAKEHDIPLYENPPLAQALYATVEIDQEVPTEHYKAVAEVISYVYRVKGRLARAR